MTVVAWDGRTLAADKMTSFGGLHATTTKVHQVGKLLVSGCGNTAVLAEMLNWVRQGSKPEDFPNSQRDVAGNASLLVVQEDGSLLQYEHTPYPLRIDNKQWAIGSGRDFAVMAMHLGKSARDAVELTSIFCTDCGNGVDSLTLDTSEEEPAPKEPARKSADCVKSPFSSACCSLGTKSCHIDHEQEQRSRFGSPELQSMILKNLMGNIKTITRRHTLGTYSIDVRAECSGSEGYGPTISDTAGFHDPILQEVLNVMISYEDRGLRTFLQAHPSIEAMDIYFEQCLLVRLIRSELDL